MSAVESKRVQNRILHGIPVIPPSPAHLAKSVLFVQSARRQIRFADFEQNRRRRLVGRALNQLAHQLIGDATAEEFGGYHYVLNLPLARNRLRANESAKLTRFLGCFFGY